MTDKTVLTTDRSKLFDFIAKAGDQDAAVDILGKRIVESLLGHHADFGAMTVLHLGGIEIECLPREGDQP